MSVVVVQGATGPDEVPGIERIAGQVELRYAPDRDSFAKALEGADVLFGWNFRGRGLQDVWKHADSLRWVQWAGAGVDSALFKEFVASDVILTNMRGLFDRAMAEWALGSILAFAKGTPDNMTAQRKAEWTYRMTRRICDQRALVVGTGSIGMETGRLLQAVGMHTVGVGRTARDGEDAFEKIVSVDDLDGVLPHFDYVVLVTPLTDATRGLFGAAQFATMRDDAVFVNMGRGALVDEAALTKALHDGAIAGAALDVFQEEPLPADAAIRGAPNCVMSPHNSGDFEGYHANMVDVFVNNLARYESGQPLECVIDKAAGFAAKG